MFSLICARINGWVNNREAGDLRRYRAHYDVIVMQWVTWSCYPIKSNGERWLQITQDDDINNPTGNEQRKPPLRSLRPNQVLQMTDYEESRINALPFRHIYSKGVCIIQRVTGSSSHLFLLLARSSSHSYTTPPNIFAVSCKVTQQWVFITVWGADIGSSFDALTDSWLSILSGHKRSLCQILPNVTSLPCWEKMTGNQPYQPTDIFTDMD